MSDSLHILLILCFAWLNNIQFSCSGCLEDNDCFPAPPSQSFDCSSYKSSDLNQWKTKYKKMVSGGKTVGYTQAAANLQHFLDGSGKDLAMRKTFLLGYYPVTNRIAQNIDKIICGIHRRGAKLSVGKSMTEEICYCASAYARFLTDLFFASGGFTIGTSTNVKIARTKNGIEYKMNNIQHTFYDPYNWEASKGLTASVPGFGSVPDSAAYCLEKSGKAKSFILRTKWSVPSKSGTLSILGKCGAKTKVKRGWSLPNLFKRQDVDGGEIMILLELVEYLLLVGSVVLVCFCVGGIFGFIFGDVYFRKNGGKQSLRA